MDKIIIHDISSDDEVGFDDSSTADNFDWISKLFEDSPVGDNVNCSNGGVVDNGHDSDDVVVVGEVVANPKKRKISVPRCPDVDDDDCVVLDFDPDKPATAEVKNSDEDSDELLIVGEKGQVACRDYPHSRHLCAKFPFISTPHESGCDLCHCYVCDSLAPCAHWGSGLSSIDHCHATDKEEYWKLERKRVRQSKNTQLPIAKPSVTPVARVPRLQQISTRAHPVPGPPNIISQGRSQRPVITVARNRFPSHLVSRQFLRTCNSNNKNPSLISSRPMFKRSAFAATNQSVHGSPNNVNVGMAYMRKRPQLAGKPVENNSKSIPLVAESSPHLNINVSYCQPTTSCMPTGGLPSQLSGYSQPNNAHTPTSQFQGYGIPASVTSGDSPYVYTSMNQTENVSIPTICNSSNAPNSVSVTQSSQQPSVATQNVSGPVFPPVTSNMPSSISERSQQPSADNCLVQGVVPMHELLPSIDQNPLLSSDPSCMGTGTDTPTGTGTGMENDNSPKFKGGFGCWDVPDYSNGEVSGTGNGNCQKLPCITNSSTLDFDIESWLSDNEPVLNAQEVSYTCDVNNQPSVTAPVDTGLLYFDFETSWKGLAHS